MRKNVMYRNNISHHHELVTEKAIFPRRRRRTFAVDFLHPQRVVELSGRSRIHRFRWQRVDEFRVER